MEGRRAKSAEGAGGTGDDAVWMRSGNTQISASASCLDEKTENKLLTLPRLPNPKRTLPLFKLPKPTKAPSSGSAAKSAIALAGLDAKLPYCVVGRGALDGDVPVTRMGRDPPVEVAYLRIVGLKKSSSMKREERRASISSMLKSTRVR